MVGKEKPTANRKVQQTEKGGETICREKSSTYGAITTLTVTFLEKGAHHLGLWGGAAEKKRNPEHKFTSTWRERAQKVIAKGGRKGGEGR